MKWGQEGFFPTNPDLADILGDMDFDFDNFYRLDFWGSNISRFPGPRFPNFQKSGLGPPWAQLGPGLGPGLGPAWARAWARLGPLPRAKEEGNDTMGWHWRQCLTCARYGTSPAATPELGMVQDFVQVVLSMLHNKLQ